MMEGPKSEDSTVEESAAEQQRREELRKKGEQFLELAAERAEKGEDAFIPMPKDIKKRRREKILREDPDVAAFGRLFQQVQLYIFASLYVLSSGASPVLIKASLSYMQTPAVLLFLHMLGVSLVLWVASSYEVFNLGQITPQALKGAAVRVSLTGLQLLCVFSTLHHNSVSFMLIWTLVGTCLVNMAASYLSKSEDLSDPQLRVILMTAMGCSALGMLFDSDTVWLGFLMMALWTGLKAVESGWQQLKKDPEAGGFITVYRLTGLIREMSDEEDALSLPTLTWLGHALPAIPILILGFIAQEGRELVNHELSVPAVKVMLLAIATYIVATCTRLVLDAKVNADTFLFLRVLATFGTVAGFFWEELWTISWVSVFFTAAACSCAFAIAKLRKYSLQTGI